MRRRQFRRPHSTRSSPWDIRLVAAVAEAHIRSGLILQRALRTAFPTGDSARRGRRGRRERGPLRWSTTITTDRLDADVLIVGAGSHRTQDINGHLVTNSSQVKVLFQEDENIETLWAERVGPDQYRLE